MSADATFHVPSACFFQISTYLPLTGAASEILAEAYRVQGDLVKTIQLLEKASTKVLRFSPIENSPLRLRLQAHLAQSYRELGRDEDARKIEAELRSLLAHADADHPILRQLGRTGEVALLQPPK